ncbi:MULTISPECIES: sulfite oxidase [unclassified Arenibacter]|jgi:DMSO/TMAO reductase YedYZ molybdopterin-dependent catalytic subunit|uniref:sulfite oxidase n=1 Tax=unclassified Arenibacter TaxID=2615047 RepID=UPI000E351026|nr:MULTISPECIES: sulfite oxidase [unclassified Arenibacter]MCM4163092.1 molybdopterin containing oxidoreductase [Arenibacter sp. A80]RFT57124.1 molybdopterin containing oxidoreductase [Arenibacter sp. P308M17]
MRRRNFVKKTSLGSLAGILGLDIVFGAKIPENYTLLGLQDPDPFTMFHKDKEMVVLNSKPWNMEAVAHVLDDRITPNKYMFIRNNGLVPENIDAKTWSITFDGESVKESKTFTLEELKSKFPHHTYQLTLECGGNGRSEFDPPAKGNQWTIGAVGCANWTGVRLKDVLKDVGIKDDAVYIGYHAADLHLSRDPNKEPISRGVPISKALQDETLLAFKMNGEDIPMVHGHPLRLVCGGWPASTSGKWINRISVRNIVHDGEKMTGSSYKVPCNPVAPGEKVKEEDMCIIESMPVKSLITYPKSGAMIPKGKSLNIRGHAWAGELEISKVSYSIDFGATWSECALEKPVNRLAWQHFKTSINFPKSGYYEVWARATDANGVSQPMLLPGWNPKGYLNNACHRIAIKVS